MMSAPNQMRGCLRVRDWSHDWGSRTLIMGIVNITPDSFSGDGIVDVDTASERALGLVEAGADIIDLGAESTRPGHTPVCVSEELDRLLPVLLALRKNSDCVISVDTTKPEVLSAAVLAGADILNSIWGLTGDLLAKVHELKIPVVLMHNKQEAVYEGEVMAEVLDHLLKQAQAALAAGICAEHIILDPGIGFGKTAEHNLHVLNALPQLVELGFPTLLGASRKSFIGKLSGKDVTDRVYGTAATTALAVAAGIDIVRVHDVAEMLDVVKVSDAMVRGWRPQGWVAP